jgi:Helix-turn-helix domain
VKLEPDEIEAIAAAVAGKLRAASENGKITPRLLSVGQGGEYLSRSAHSIRHLIKAGKLPVVKIDGRIFLDIRDLDRAIENSKQVAL